LKINRLHGLIHVLHYPMGWCECGQIGHRDLLEVQDPGTPHVLDLRRRSSYQEESGRIAWHRFLKFAAFYRTTATVKRGFFRAFTN
jgi:hypothetical protein